MESSEQKVKAVMPVMKSLWYGFDASFDSTWVLNRFFPQKMGGKPKWLELDILPCAKKLRCHNCNQPMTFVGQIYAPLSHGTHNYHRAIFLFSCLANCRDSMSKSVVFRSSLPNKNKFYAEEPIDINLDPLPPVTTAKQLCVLCGCVAKETCKKCKKNHFCSELHSILFAKNNKNVCQYKSTDNNNIIIENVVLPEIQINFAKITHISSSKDRLLEIVKVQQLLKEYMRAKGQIYFNELIDEYITAEAMEVNPTTINDETETQNKLLVRYNRGGQPLWLNATENFVEPQIIAPNCELCGSPRIFEFQVTSEIFNLWSKQNADWDALYVYTCSESCEIPDGVGYADEFIIRHKLRTERK